MKLPYYDHQLLCHIEIHQACPGCGKKNGLAMHDVIKSYMKDKRVYYVACKCGWQGPDADNAVMAAVKWDARVMIYG
jgi:hypothetical protein